tara:strand:+ start:4451 stop:5035 length:585 start_codon:yes stop_codon:yes gene_type:complete
MNIIKNNIANSLTIARILLLPLMVLFFYLEESQGSVVIWLCFFTFALSAITDFFDGYFARKLNQVSALGTFLDPISDKIFVSTMLILLVAFGRITGTWVLLVMIIFAREFMVSGIREYLGPKNIQVPVSVLAKWKTTVQMLSIGFLILSDYSPYAYEIGIILLCTATILTLITGMSYLLIGLKHMKDEPEKDEQ